MKPNTKKLTALIQGGLGAEKEISLTSGRAAAKALKELNIPFKTLLADHNLPKKLLALKPKRAFIALHGKYGEDGLVQALLEYLKIPYTGSGVMASAVSMDKVFFKQYMVQHKIPTPPFQMIDRQKKNQQKIKIPLPLVIKPSREGSSLGVSICRKKEDIPPALKKAGRRDHQIIIEPYIKGMETAFSFLDGKVLTPVEIKPKKGFYDYKNKYSRGATEYILPARLPKSTIKKCKNITLKAVKLLNIHSYARADFIIQEDRKPFLLEINTLPGLTKLSLFPKSAEHDGISFNKLIQKILKQARLDYENIS